MPRFRLVASCGVLLLTLGLGGWQAVAAAESVPQLLTGPLWQVMSADAKVAYIWGIGNLADLESNVRPTLPTTATPPTTPSVEGKSFLPWLIKGLEGTPINEVVRQVDAYYQAHPDQLNRSVIDALFQAVVIPRITAEQQRGGSGR
jgi:hypothetical protein